MSDDLSTDVNRLIVISCGTLLLAHSLSANTPTTSKDEAGSEFFTGQVRPLIQNFCVNCHGEDEPEGGLRLDSLKPNFETPEQFATWLRIYDKLAKREMPPSKRTQPSEQDREMTMQWIAQQLSAIEGRRRRDDGRAVIRRLNRIEYHNTVRDLLGISLDMKPFLPADPAADGFDTVGAALNTSPELMEAYLEAADSALDAAIMPRAKPKQIEQRFSYKQDKAGQYPRIFLIKDDAVVLFGTCCTPTTLTQFHAQAAGTYRFKISSYAHQSSQPISFRVYAGPLLEALGAGRLIDHFETASRPCSVEFEHFLNTGETIQILPDGTGDGFKKMEPVNYKGPGLAVQWIEIKGPLHSEWPPASHRQLLGVRPMQPLTVTSNGFSVNSTYPVDAEQLLSRFLRRAFRRPATDEELELYISLALQRLQEGASFEQAMRTTYRAILVSPSFLFRTELPGKLNDYALASRLSYFLWSSMPDERLLALADEGRLTHTDVLHDEVERMLNSPKAQEFVRNFAGQWLGLRKVNDTVPDKVLYPEYDDLLQTSLLREPEAFFSEMLKNDLSIANFVDSEFAFLNGRLAQHYGIAGVEGLHLRKVTLPKGSHRGGLLGQAAILKITANGTTTSPVQRGIWLLENLLGQRPPPPPSGTPAIEPDIRGAISIRDQLAKHQSVDSCAKCHTKIDPPGLALENFDVIGGWREFYRSAGEGESVQLVVKGDAVRYRKGMAVDATTLISGKAIRSIEELKEVLLEHKEEVVRCVAMKLLTYATGEGIRFSDREEIQRLVESSRPHNHGLRTMVHLMVGSELFLRK